MCGYWLDRNENGMGTCSNKDSGYNGQQVTAMHSCSCLSESPVMLYVSVKNHDVEERRIPQKSKCGAKMLAKTLAMDIVEDLSETKQKPSECSICEDRIYIRCGDEYYLISIEQAL